jgi:competence protein ComEC
MTPLVLFALAWGFGILLADAVAFPAVWLLLPLPAALALYLGWGGDRWARRGAMMLLALSLGAGRVMMTERQRAADTLPLYLGQEVATWVGVVIAEPARCGMSTCLRVAVEERIQSEQPPQPVSGKLLLTAPLYTPAVYGDRIRFNVDLKQPPASPNFSYRDYLARQGIFVQATSKTVTVISSGHANPILLCLSRAKAYAYTVVQELLPEPQGALLGGILLGIERDLPPDLVEAFRVTGTSHIVAISGMNLAVIAGAINQWARRLLNQRRGLLLSLATVWVYVVLVGGSPPVLRAGVMSSIAMVALQEQRAIHGPTALAAAAVVLTCLDPYAFWDLGFQLSFTATVALMLYVPLLGRWVRTLLSRVVGDQRAETFIGLIWDAVIVTLAVQIATLGVTVGTSGELSLVSPLTNSLILPAQPFIMTFGSLALIFGILLRPLGIALGWLAWAFLWYTIAMVRWCATFPWAMVELGAIAPLTVWIYYGALALGTVCVTLPSGARTRIWEGIKTCDRHLIAAGIGTVVILVGYIVTQPDGNLHVTFLDVGHGDAVLIQTPSGSRVLIDGGPDPRQTLSELGDHLPFWDRALDLVILTSPDTSRLNGLVPVLTRYDVAAVAIGPEVSEGPTWDAWQAELEAWEGKIDVLVASVVHELDDGVRLHVLWPPPHVIGPAVLQIAYQEIRILLLGDATTLVEQALVAAHTEALDSDILQLARHGAQTSTSVPLLQAVSPDIAVVSRSDRFDLSPYIEARLMDIPLYRTDFNGAIHIRSDGRSYRVKTAR